MTAWETVGFGLTSSGAFLGATGFAGQSGTVRNTALGGKVALEALWASNATAAQVRVRSPRLHDNVQGIRYDSIAAVPLNLLGRRPFTPLVPQDVLIVEVNGTNTEVDSAYLQVSYASLPGADGNYVSWEQIKPRVVDIMTQQVINTAVATANNWSPGLAINVNTDLMKANTWYALLGYVASAVGGALAIHGPDTGGLFVGGPLSINPLETREWFLEMDLFSEEPAIPVINSANKGGTFLNIGHTAATYTGNVDLLFAELAGSTLG
jgi:hypothetical protein